MLFPTPIVRSLSFFFTVNLLFAQAPGVLNVDLKPETSEGFNRCVQLTEARIQSELTRPGEFLYIEGLPEPKRSQVFALLKHGEIYMERLKTLDPSGRKIDAPGGLIHHWMGAVYIPGVTLLQTLAFVQDYDRHAEFYKPEVVRSRLLSHHGDDYKIFYRFRKKKVITVTLNTDHDVHYFPVDGSHCYSSSYSMRIAEVADADKPTEHEKRVGHDGGFLWRIDSYWRFEQRDGGVYVECESVSLTRDIPTGLGWLIGPFITSLPKESLRMTMDSTRAGVLARNQAAAKP